MRPSALAVVAALQGRAPLTALRRSTGLSAGGLSRALGELESLGLVERQREGFRTVAVARPHPAMDALRNELRRFPGLDLSSVTRGRRAAVVAGVGFAGLPFVRRATGLSEPAFRSALRQLRGQGVLRRDLETQYRVSPAHSPLQKFCQGVLDLEAQRALGGASRGAIPLLWSRSCEALIATDRWPAGVKNLRVAAYTAAARLGLEFMGRDRFGVLSRRPQTRQDTALQCLLTGSATRLSRTHVAIILRAGPRKPMDEMARWYGLEAEIGPIERFAFEGSEEPALLPRADAREIAQRYGVRI